MSYLPRMSKTYKEPQQEVLKEPEENLSFNALKPASSLLNEKIYNPQTILKHYRYHPHPLPVLPGPSVLEEALENELYRENIRLRRSTMKTISKTIETVERESAEQSEDILPVKEFSSEVEESMKRPRSRKGLKKNKNILGKRKSAKYLKKENSSKIAINVCLVKTEKPFTAERNERNSKDLDFEFFNHDEKTSQFRKSVPPDSSLDKLSKTKNLMDLLKEEKLGTQSNDAINKSTQCAIVGNFSKSFVIPYVIHSLLHTLAFLLHELSKETISSYSKEKKIILAQSQSSLNSLCNEKIEKEYSFDITYSDFKRLEKILGELKKYLKDIYGDKSESIDKMEDLKRVFIELRKKEMELFDLGEKLKEIGDIPKEILVKEKDLRNPEVTLQNNRLESEQLMAELEFSFIELKNYQKSLAELDWDIKNLHKQMTNLKKSVSSNSKTEMLGKRGSLNKFSSELLQRGSRSRESDTSNKKKT